MSDTPRTDRETVVMNGGVRCVHVELARTLERELREALDVAEKAVKMAQELRDEIATGAHDSANYPGRPISATELLSDLRNLWPEIRQLQDGFMNGDPNFTAWDHSVRDRCIAMSARPEAAHNDAMKQLNR